MAGSRFCTPFAAIDATPAGIPVALLEAVRNNIVQNIGGVPTAAFGYAYGPQVPRRPA